MTETTATPALDRPQFHVWITEDPADDPTYAGVVTIINADQLRAETEAKGLGIRNLRESPFHLTNLWIWAAAARTGLATTGFHQFVNCMEYRPVEDDEPGAGEGAEDPTTGAQGPSTGSA